MTTTHQAQLSLRRPSLGLSQQGQQARQRLQKPVQGVQHQFVHELMQQRLPALQGGQPHGQHDAQQLLALVALGPRQVLLCRVDSRLLPVAHEGFLLRFLLALLLLANAQHFSRIRHREFQSVQDEHSVSEFHLRLVPPCYVKCAIHRAPRQRRLRLHCPALCGTGPAHCVPFQNVFLQLQGIRFLPLQLKVRAQLLRVRRAFEPHRIQGRLLRLRQSTALDRVPLIGDAQQLTQQDLEHVRATGQHASVHR